MKKMKNRRSSKAQPLVPSYIPEEIIRVRDILLRLPVKTLVIFRCVSKSWLNLISNTNFINTHLLNSSKSNTFDQQKVVLWCNSIIDSPHTESNYLKSYSLHSLFDPPSANGDYINSHSLQPYYWCKYIVGSCNGLVCIVLDREFLFIWNTSSGQSKKLPVLEWEIMQPNYGVGSSYCYLAVLEGCISVCSNYYDTRADIWVMKEYGVRDSWVKLYTIPYHDIQRRDGYLRDVLFCDSVTGEIVLKFGAVLVSYHTNNGTFRNETISTLDATAYVESLVSP